MVKEQACELHIMSSNTTGTFCIKKNGKIKNYHNLDQIVLDICCVIYLYSFKA